MPEDAGPAFLARLIEAFADEWLMLPMFDYRWLEAFDRDFCPRRQMAGWLGAVPDEQFSRAVEAFRSHQEFVLGLIGRAAAVPVGASGGRHVGRRGDVAQTRPCRQRRS